MYNFTKEELKKALSFEDFQLLTKKILEDENKEAPYNDVLYNQYTQINYDRSQKIIRNFQIDKKLYNLLNEDIKSWTWVIINEPWCGDGSFILPVLYALSLASDSNIDVKIILRDKNVDIMNEYLTNGGMSIPKLVCLDKDLNEIGTWGPRPKVLTEQINIWKEMDDFDMNTKIKKVNRWYIKDKNQNIQKEFIELIKDWKKK